MQFKLSLVAFVGVVASLTNVSALPAAKPLEAREEDAATFDGHLFVCTDDGFSGSCLNIGFYSQVCQNFPDGYNDQISSVGPDQGWNCELFIDDNCNDDQGTYWVEYPGFSSLSYGNDAFSSFQCYRT
ncbi:hypothetical protein NM688_g52 [Phlebia brevispora]|uniref:Uncharacterized protein n=1 Tax=Phlebia brevispora TaxID=194682 RepID=A0ACC1TF66_9APHY|nr:hypothetical protein NM688_g52 [Phlebia brevispora]